MPRTRVKICGVNRPEHGLAAALLGADAIGLVFYPPSPRAVDIAAAREVAAALPPFVTVVGLFLNAEPSRVREVISQVPIHLLQFHGDEETRDCAAFGLPFVKAVPMGAGADVRAYERRFAEAAGLLLDSHGGTGGAGSGLCFDWNLIPVERAKPLILAGGLTPSNVAEAVRRVRPYAVDVSSGVEIKRGVKDINLIQAFIEAVRQGDQRA